MGRLSGRGLPNRLGRPASRLRPAPSTEAERDKRRETEQPWRKWYRTARWQKLRRQVLARDGYVCRQTGVVLSGKHPAPNSPTVDHIRPHRGNEELFFDPDNLQSVSKEWHDGAKQRIERRGSE